MGGNVLFLDPDSYATRHILDDFERLPHELLVPPQSTVTRLKSTSPRAGSIGDLLDEFNDGPPNVALLDPPECLRKTQRIRRIEEIDDVASAFPIAGHAERAAEKEQDGHVQDFGNLLQPSDLNAVVSGLIFFHLLERHAERKTQ